MVLVCDYDANIGENAAAYILLGCCYRIIRVLDLDSPRISSKSDDSTEMFEEESRKRLVWACFIIDTRVGNGVDCNLSWRDRYPRITLPLPDYIFMSRMSITDTSQSVTLESMRDPELSSKAGLQAHVIYFHHLRSEVLRLIRQNLRPEEVCRPGSAFVALMDQIESWYRNLPQQLLLTDLNHYIQKEENTLGVIYSLHLGYHAATFDLSRVSLPGFSFPLALRPRGLKGSISTEVQVSCRSGFEDHSQRPGLRRCTTV